MQLDSLISFLKNNNINYKENVEMKKYTTLKIGGLAPLMVLPSSVFETSNIIKFLYKYNIKYFVIGCGSDLLIQDDKINIVFIKTDFMNSIECSDDILIAGSGCKDSKVSIYALKHNLSGVEFLHGIPGSIGGAFFMNAGAYGHSISDVAYSAEYVDNKGEIHSVSGDNFDFGYRKSCFCNGDVICNVKLKLSYGNANSIKDTMDNMMMMRKNKQPLEFPSAGSVFKRPAGNYAGKLIQECNLMGYTIGGAQVSTKHAGFIVNTGTATSNDVKELISYIQDAVFTKFGIMLEPEVIIL